jgi:hypothetical protein
MEVRNDLVCHGWHTYTYLVATRLSLPNKEEAPALEDRGFQDRRRGVGVVPSLQWGYTT